MDAGRHNFNLNISHIGDTHIIIHIIHPLWMIILKKIDILKWHIINAKFYLFLRLIIKSINTNLTVFIQNKKIHKIF